MDGLGAGWIGRGLDWGRVGLMGRLWRSGSRMDFDGQVLKEEGRVDWGWIRGTDGLVDGWMCWGDR